jgi:hypothetical protein
MSLTGLDPDAAHIAVHPDVLTKPQKRSQEGLRDSDVLAGFIGRKTSFMRGLM